MASLVFGRDGRIPLGTSQKPVTIVPKQEYKPSPLERYLRNRNEQ